MSVQNIKLHFSAEEDEKLTESVRKHPALYDMKHALYRDTRVKDNIWKEVAQYVERSVAKCKKRWKNIKDTYDRKKRERTPTGSQSEHEQKRKKWQLAERLSFLQSADSQRESITIPRSSEYTATEHVREEEPDAITLSDYVEANNNESTCTTSAYATSPPSIYSPSEISSQLTKKVVSSSPKLKQPHSRNRDKFASVLERRDKERTEILKRLMTEEEDDVDLFFKSLAKSVKKLRPDLRTQAKLQTSNVVANLENEMQSSQWVTNIVPPACTSISSDSNIASPAENVLQIDTRDSEGGASLHNLLML